MRLTAVDRLAVGDRLGRDVLVGASSTPYLRTGIRLSQRYIDGLRRMGVRGVYVDDELTAGIEPLAPIREETRRAAVTGIVGAFDAVTHGAGGVAPAVPGETIDALRDVAARIAADVAACGDAVVALSDLATVDAYTVQHAIDVTALGLLLEQRHLRRRGWVDWTGKRRYDRFEERLVMLGTGLLLHDIGKLAVPAELLRKNGPLTPEEQAIVREHPVIGFTMLAGSDSLSLPAKAVVKSHHERWDGSGYPSGLVGERIPKLARLAAVADVFDAITAERPYKGAQPVHVGVEAIAAGAGTDFDPEIVETFVRTVAPYPPSTVVEVSDGRRAVVVECPAEALDRPRVRMLSGPDAAQEIALVEHPQLTIAAAAA